MRRTAVLTSLVDALRDKRCNCLLRLGCSLAGSRRRRHPLSDASSLTRHFKGEARFALHASDLQRASPAAGVGFTPIAGPQRQPRASR